MKFRFTLSLLLLGSIALNAQTTPTKLPKLAVGIVVDQMRPEYLYRFAANFGKGGFNRLTKDGFVCYNTHINYLPTITGPGHASIYTGTTPKYHGISGNNWFDRTTRKSVYCAQDSLVESVGNDKKVKGSYSARNILVPTFSDVLKLSTAKHGKVYAMSMKDRGAAFPAGHAADGAFWFDKKTGNFITSSYYMDKLPDWLTKFNQQRKAESYLDSTWKPVLVNDNYPFSLPDSISKKYGNSTPLSVLSQKPLRQFSKSSEPYSVIYSSPFGNKILADLAIETIKNAGLGTDNYPDLLAISFSSPDAVGHAFGPLSEELNDTYIRLDYEISRVLDALDKYVGKDNYVLFLTADHGMSDIPQLLVDNKIPGGYFDGNKFRHQIDSVLSEKYGSGKWIDTIYEDQIYLDHQLFSKKGNNLVEAQELIANFARTKEGIVDAFTADQLTRYDYDNSISGRVQKGYFYRRGGDVQIVYMPGWMDKGDKTVVAATHGSGFNSDTNIPLIWYGSGIKNGQSYVHYDVTDITPTVSALLHIAFPSAAIGNPIVEVLK
jgi:predicted AlkP superfamily pyrophosphatase or phosphodiesterase